MVEGLRSPENLGSSQIRQITFVVPAYNEAENIHGLAANLNTLIVPDGVQLRVVLSNNGSTDNTRELAEQSNIRERPMIIPQDSIARSIGSARRVGVEQAITTFHEEQPTADSSEHVIVNFDADTRVPSVDFLSAIADIFSNPNIMVAYGPLEWVSRDGSVERRYKYIQHQLTTIRLKHLFRAYGRKRSHYTNGSQDIPGACNVVRESAVRDSEGNITLNFNQLDRVGEDIRFSLELQRRFHHSQIVKDNRLLMWTSARGLETPSGRISRIRGVARLLEVLLVGDHVPATTRIYQGEEGIRRQRRIQNMSTVEPNENFFDVVCSYISDIDRQTYQLQNGEYVKEVIRLRRVRFLQRRMHGEDIRQAISAINGEVIPHYYAIIGRVE